MTMKELADGMNKLTPEQIAKAMGTLPTEALEWGVRFEALARRAPATVKIKETFELEIAAIEEDDLYGEDYRLEQLRMALSRFVRRIADTYSKSPAESELINLAVAKDIFDSVHAAAVAEILRERLLRNQEGFL